MIVKKKPIPIFKGTAKSGKPIIEQSQDWFLYLCTLEGQELEFTARKKQKKKSNKQNKYYRAVVVELLGDHLGYHPDEMHGVLQLEFFLYENDKGIKYIRSTKLTDWDTVEWEDKMSEIRQWASEKHSLYIPLPNEVNY